MQTRGNELIAQVIENLDAITMRDGKPLEAVITEGMHHPNIVNTIAHTVQQALPQQSQQHMHDSAHSTRHSPHDSAGTPLKTAKSLQPEGVAWLVLEYCDMGCLQVTCCCLSLYLKCLRKSCLLSGGLFILGAASCWSMRDAACLLCMHGSWWLLWRAQEAVDKGWMREERSLTSVDGVPCLATILAVALEIAQGMSFLHERNVVHGDLTGGGRPPCSPHLWPLLTVLPGRPLSEQ